MPHLSQRQKLLDDLTSAHQQLQLARYQDLLRTAVSQLGSNDSTDTDSDLSNSSHSSSGSSAMSWDSMTSDWTVDSLVCWSYKQTVMVCLLTYISIKRT